MHELISFTNHNSLFDCFSDFRLVANRRRTNEPFSIENERLWLAPYASSSSSVAHQKAESSDTATITFCCYDSVDLQSAARSWPFIHQHQYELLFTIVMIVSTSGFVCIAHFRSSFCRSSRSFILISVTLPALLLLPVVDGLLSSPFSQLFLVIFTSFALFLSFCCTQMPESFLSLVCSSNLNRTQSNLNHS
jgi:hypothetical protein